MYIELRISNASLAATYLEREGLNSLLAITPCTIKIGRMRRKITASIYKTL